MGKDSHWKFSLSAIKYFFVFLSLFIFIKNFDINASESDIKEGEALFQKCTSCHGTDGLGRKSQQAPMLAGQHASYVIKQITEIQAGKRKNANTQRMYPFISKLTPIEIGKLAQYIQQMKKRN